MALTFKNVAPIVQPDLEKSYFESSSGITKIRIGAKNKPAPNLNQSFEHESGSEKQWINFNRKSVVVDKEQWDFADDILSLSVGKQVDRFYHIDNETFRFDVVYNEDPTLEDIDFHIEVWEVKSSVGLIWCYQDTLENDYLRSSEGAKTLEEYLSNRNRPTNVVGSYTVYGTYQNHIVNAVGKTIYNAATGKLFHIYRPKLIDSLGTERWCELNFDELTSELRIKCNFKGLVFPVILDPDIGYTTVGGSSIDFDNAGRVNSEDASGVDFVVSDIADKLLSVSLYTGAGWDKEINAGVYDYLTSVPRNRIENQTKNSGYTSGGWTVINMAGTTSLTPSTSYCPAAAWGGFNGNLYYDTPANGEIGTLATATLPDPYAGDLYTGYLYSLYFTYSESAEGISIPVAMQNMRGGFNPIGMRGGFINAN